jgi:hypothetical protein
MKMIGSDKLFVGTHEWAWSLRTQGFPIFAILRNGETRTIGTTTKRATIYTLPSGTIAILREYVSNSGRRRWFIYSIPDLKEYEVGDNNDWDVSELPSGLREIIEEMAKKILIEGE